MGEARLAGEHWWRKPGACPAGAKLIRYRGRNYEHISCVKDLPDGTRLKHGRDSAWWASGARAEETTYVNGKERQARQWSEEGVLTSETEYLDPKADHCVVKEYGYYSGRPTGSLEMLGGERHGRQAQYYDNGKVKAERRFRNGKLVPGSEKTYTPDGKPSTEPGDWGP